MSETDPKNYKYLVNGKYRTYNELVEYCDLHELPFNSTMNNAKRVPIGTRIKPDRFSKEDLLYEFPLNVRQQYYNDIRDENNDDEYDLY